MNCEGKHRFAPLLTLEFRLWYRLERAEMIVGPQKLLLLCESSPRDFGVAKILHVNAYPCSVPSLYKRHECGNTPHYRYLLYMLPL